MTGKHQLPYPCLTQHTVHELSFLTDDALASSVGVYAGFTFRGGGVSKAPYDSLNLATHVNDNASDVQQNRQLLLDALGFSQAPLLVPNQVHGTNMVTVESCANATWINYVAQAQEGADGVIVTTANAVTLLCFADCLPAIVVSPSGQFAVLHAGWRGALAGIVGKAIQRMINAGETLLMHLRITCILVRISARSVSKFLQRLRSSSAKHMALRYC